MGRRRLRLWRQERAAMPRQVIIYFLFRPELAQQRASAGKL